jgi:MFS family permease
MQTSEQKVATNFFKVYVYRFFSGFWLIAPVLIPFYEANGLTATQIFLVQAVYALSLLIFEVPSGYLSDVIGRKNALILGSIALPVGLAAYAFSYGFWGFAIAEVILGIAGSLRSGTDSALMYDSLIQMGREPEYDKFEGTAEFFHRAADSTSSILGGLFALTSLRYPFYINIASGLILFPLAISFIEPRREQLEAKYPFLEIMEISHRCITDRRLRWLMLYSSLLVSSGIVGIWSYYMYYDKLGLSVGLFGFLFAVFGLFSAVGASQAYFVERKLGRRRSLSMLLVIALNFLSLGAFMSVMMLPCIFLNAFLWGLSAPLFMKYINELVESDVRATVLSVCNMFGSLSFVVLSPLFGKLIDYFSLSLAYFALGIFFLSFGLVCLLHLSRQKII